MGKNVIFQIETALKKYLSLLLVDNKLISEKLRVAFFYIGNHLGIAFNYFIRVAVKIVSFFLKFETFSFKYR